MGLSARLKAPHGRWGSKSPPRSHVAWEGLNRNLLVGDVHAVSELDVRLTRPLVLPHEVGLYVRGRELSLADALGGPAYLTGTFRLRGEP